MIKRLFMGLLALAFPWLVFLIEDNPRAALIAFTMQATVIGWLPATIWAFSEMRKNRIAQRKAVNKPGNRQDKEHN
jgi:hypothetical protein